MLDRRVRYFGDALVMGSEGFVEAVFQKFRRKLGLRRTVGARKARDVDIGNLRVMRDLRGLHHSEWPAKLGFAGNQSLIKR